MTNILKLSVSILLLFIISCKTSEPVVDVVKSSQKEVTALTLGNISGATSTFDASTNTHTFSVPSGTNVKALALTFTLPNGATSSPASGSVQDFTNPVSYTITAEDGTKQVIKIAVNVQATPRSSEKQILEFSFNALNPVVKANIDQTSRKITATVTASTDLTKLIPTIITSPKATVSPASGAVQNFSNKVIYDITAEDGSIQGYDVIITKIESSIVDDVDLVFFGSNDGKFYALNAKNGEKKWNFSTDNKILASPTYANGIVYFGGMFNNFFAINSTNGSKIWEYKINHKNVSPSIQGDYICFGSYEETIVAKSSNGELVRRIGLPLTESPMVEDNIFYFGYGGFDASLNKFVNDFNFRCGFIAGIFSYFNPNPVLNNGTIFCNDSQDFVARNIKTGIYKWKFKTDASYFSSSTLNDGIIYFCNSNGASSDKLYALNAETGKKIWEQSYSFRISSPTVFGGQVIVGSLDGKLYSFDAKTGTLKWSFSTNGVILSSPVVVNDIVFFGSNDKNFYAIDAKSGKSIWTFSTQGEIESSPCVITKNGKIFLSSLSGEKH